MSDIVSHTVLVKKICHYTQTPFEEGRYLYQLVTLAEEAKIKARVAMHNLQLELQIVKDNLNNMKSAVECNSKHTTEYHANIEIYNRCMDYLLVELKKVIKPVWGVYWGESCTGMDIICAWVEKADKDNGEKVFAKLEELAQ